MVRLTLLLLLMSIVELDMSSEPNGELRPSLNPIPLPRSPLFRIRHRQGTLFLHPRPQPAFHAVGD